MDQKIIFTNQVGQTVDELVAALDAPQAVVISDVNSAQFVLPLLVNDSKVVASARQIIVKSGDANKTLQELTAVWKQLSDAEASRHTVVINVGGGVVTDLGGFAAATFKRGLRCINVPTTLLAAVDASVGGKTGINFNGVKNQIGSFTEPVATIVSTAYFNTLPQQQLLSGYAEMIKHALLEDEATLARVLKYSPVYPTFDSEALLPLLQASVLTKQKICENDLLEKGLRRSLNLGHTIGHAMEAYALRQGSPIPHGYAVAWGMVTELVLSHMLLNFPSETLHTLAAYIFKNYGAHELTCDDYPALIELMRQDKKNVTPDKINFTLLEAVGKPRIDCTATEEQIKAALDIYRDLSGQ